MGHDEHALDPSLSKHFVKRLPEDLESSSDKILSGREIFYYLGHLNSHPEILQPAYYFVKKWLFETERIYHKSFVLDHQSEALPIVELPASDKRYWNIKNQHDCINQTAAILLTQPSWLANISTIVSCQTSFSTRLMSVYLAIIKNEDAGGDLVSLCRSLILSCSGEIPVLYSYSYCRNPEILENMFDFAAIQLAFTSFPRIFFPEILGFTLAYCQSPSLSEICFPQQQCPLPFFRKRKQRIKNQLPVLHICIKDYLNLFSQQETAIWRRIQQGFWLYQLQMQRCRDQFNEKLETPSTPQQRVASLFQKKKLAAIGHHHAIKLEGKSLDSWLAEMPGNSQQFLRALKKSNYVNSANPSASRLLKLFEFHGPMFGVLDLSELQIVRDWLQHGLSEDVPIKTVKQQQNFCFTEPAIHVFRSAKTYSGLNNRKLYYYLINADLFPYVVPEAKRRVTRLLQWCSWLNPLPFKHYRHEQFESWIDQGYQREVAAYKPLQGKPKISREAYIWGIEQIAPMILIDGCWIQNSQSLLHDYPEIAGILFDIYCDEIGNGELQQNHPFIFRQLLKSLSINLPAVHSESFIGHPGFINSAFDLPSYMLALSYHSTEFLPELLGLNMAIEVSGLGKDYMRLVDEWKYWGIDAEIASIHISIDNIASGHTFLAKKAIQIYMDDVLHRTGDYAILDKHWQRICSGYASLRLVGARFKFGLPIRYLIYKFFKSNRC